MVKVTYEAPPPIVPPSKLTAIYQKVQTKVFKKEMPPSDPGSVDKPVESIHPDNLPEVNQESISRGLAALVDQSSKHDDSSQSIHAHMAGLGDLKWIHKIIPGIEKLWVPIT
jgi:hypothetical protein